MSWTYPWLRSVLTANLPSVPMHIRVEAGSPHEEVSRVAKQLHADIIVVGTVSITVLPACRPARRCRP